MQKTVFVLGARGYIGSAFVRCANAAGLRVLALIRHENQRAELQALGASCVVGDAQQPQAWIAHAAQTDLLVDLVQPALPRRLTVRAIQQVARQRLAITEALAAALATLSPAARPLWLNVSGVDDLEADSRGLMSGASALRAELQGFAHIGVPVRRAIEAAGPASAFVYLGTVYGPGKAFAETLFPGLRAGTLRLPGPGRNRMALIHVEDATAGLVALCQSPRATLQGRTLVLTDGQAVTQRDFFAAAAAAMGARPVTWVPRWLASLVAGRVLVETLTRDTPTLPFFAEGQSGIGVGMQLTYPSYREGLPATLTALGYTVSRAAATKSTPTAGIQAPSPR